MRKALAILLVLLVICSAGIVAAHAVINPQRDQVTITENVVYGDKLAADGLNIVRKAQWDRRLHWSTDYNISAENEYSTEFYFTQERYNEPYVRNYYSGSVSFNLYPSGGIGSSHAITREELTEIFPGFEDLCLDVMERAPAGEEYSEEILLSDYFDYYPLQVFTDFENKFYIHRYNEQEFVEPLIGDESEEVNIAFRNYFRIPVSEGDTINVTLYKEPSGIVTDINLYGSGKGPDFYTYSEVTDNEAYFLFNSGKSIDFTNIPDGCGIYRLPFTEFEFQGGVYPTVDAEGLEMVYPIDESVNVEGFFLDESGERLILITTEEDKFIFTAIDAATMETLQRFEVAERRNDGGIWYISQSDGFLTLFIDGDRLAVLDILENGDYSVNYVVERCPKKLDETFWFRSDCILAYDGERLAVAWDLEQEHPPYENCGFTVAVYDSTGLLYLGDYESGLMTGLETEVYNYLCQPEMYNNLLLEWK